MKPFSAELAALFDTRSFVSADLYGFTLQGGGGASVTSADQDLAVQGINYLSGKPRIERSPLSQKTGLQVSSVKITIYPTPSDLITGISWLSALRRGLFDGATVTIQRAFAPRWDVGTTSMTGTILMLAGRVADVTIGRSKAEIEVNSWTELLSNQMPRAYYQSACNNVLGDSRCSVNRSSFAEAGAIVAVGSASVFDTTCPAEQNWFALGTITMTSGVCAGEQRPISFNTGPTQLGNGFALQIPFSVPPSIGDTFIAYAGCNKMRDTCQIKFNNLSRFAGYPFIPAPETAV